MYEAKDVIGGMMRLVPVFRLPWEIIQRDVDRILDLGVTLEMEHLVDVAPEALLDEGFDAVYVATGFQKDTPLNIPGVKEAKKGVYAALNLLDRVRRGEQPDIGKKALVIGGGDTAMDAVRTSRRLTGNPTTIVYRRTRAEMPASPEEIEGALEEGNILEELVTPVRVVLDDEGAVTGLACVRNQLGEPGPDGRRRPVVIPGSDFVIPCDSIMVAVGQTPELSFLDGSVVTLCSDGGIAIEHGHGPHAGAERLCGRRRGRSRAGEHHRGLRRRPPGGGGHLRASSTFRLPSRLPRCPSCRKATSWRTSRCACRRSRSRSRPRCPSSCARAST